MPFISAAIFKNPLDTCIKRFLARQEQLGS